MQPFRDPLDKDGFRPLEKLADFSNVDKHRRLHVLSQAPRSGTLTSPIPLMPEWRWRPGPIGDGEEFCSLVFDTPTDLGPEAYSPTFALCLAESDGSEAWDLGEIGTRLIAWVRHRVLTNFEQFFR